MTTEVILDTSDDQEAVEIDGRAHTRQGGRAWPAEEGEVFGSPEGVLIVRDGRWVKGTDEDWRRALYGDD